MCRRSASRFVAWWTVYWGRAGRFSAVRASPATWSLRVAIALLLLPAGSAVAATVVRTSPRLTPSFRDGIPDYTVRCTSGAPVSVEVHAARRTRVKLDGGRLGRGSFEARRSLSPGQAFGFEVRQGKSVRHHLVRCVPADFPTWTVHRSGRPEVRWIAFAPNVSLTTPAG